MKKIIPFVALCACIYSTAHAEIRVNGFANLVGGITKSDETLYAYEDNISFSEESLFAIQIIGDINDKMTATGQILARGSDDYDAKLEWAYITYNYSDNLNISAGRFRQPLFRYSSSQDIGYSYHWVSAPQSVYDVPFNSIEGVRLDYNNYVGDWEYALQLAVGNYSVSNDLLELDGRNNVTASIEATYDYLKLRLVYGQADTTLNLRPVAPLLAQLEQTLPADLFNNLKQEEDLGKFIGVGIEIDKFDWFVSGEFTSVNTEDSFLTEDIAYYVTAGLRFGKYTPSITYERVKDEDDLKFADQLVGLPPALVGAVAGLQNAFINDDSTVTLGVRFDHSANVALKADLTKYTDDKDASGNSDATLLRFAINYVF